jgi:hypothetical protein
MLRRGATCQGIKVRTMKRRAAVVDHGQEYPKALRCANAHIGRYVINRQGICLRLSRAKVESGLSKIHPIPVPNPLRSDRECSGGVLDFLIAKYIIQHFVITQVGCTQYQNPIVNCEMQRQRSVPLQKSTAATRFFDLGELPASRDIGFPPY